MNCYRIVTTQNGKEHISGVVLSRNEANDYLDVERDLHEGTGWKVTSISGVLLCERLAGMRKIRRTIEVRAFTPLEDKPPNLSRQT